MKKKNLANVIIFGRANVGKSTLFNRLTEKEQAIISPLAGTTRDSNRGRVEWQEKVFNLVDTGGIIDLKYLTGKKTKTDEIEAEVQKQATTLLKGADLVIFLVDGQAGVLPPDKTMAIFLKKTFPDKNKVFLVANKIDSPRLRKELGEFYQLGLGEPLAVSAASGSGTGDLLDKIVKKIKGGKSGQNKNAKFCAPDEAEEAREKKKEKAINITIVGQPNAGKSSLLNSILGEKRVIVSPVPHTTREPQDIDIIYENQPIKLVDTAGLSRRGQQAAYRRGERHDLGKQSVVKSLKALDRSEVALFVLDINSPITHQDSSIAEAIISRRKGLVIIANKWDLVPEKDTKKYTAYIRDNLPFVNWAPIQFVSALTGEKIKKIMDLAIKISMERKRTLSAGETDFFLKKIIKIHRPTKGKGNRRPRIYEFKQLKSGPPIFEARIGREEDLHFSYVRFIENRLREKFGFTGTPITVIVKKGRA